MGMREWRRFFHWAFVLFFCVVAGWSPTVWGAPPTVYDFRLTQGSARLPVVTVYADIIGAGEVPAKGLTQGDFTAKIGPASAKVSRITPFEDAKEGIGYVLLVDVSKSLSAAQFAQMKETLAAFVDAMSNRDQAALVTFGSDVKLIQDYSPNRGKLKEKLAELRPTDDDTAFYGGLDKAVAVARAGGAEVPARRVVITLTDGVNDIAGGVSKGDISAKLTTDPVPLYLIGFVPGAPTPEEQSAMGVMKDFAAQSGGRFYDGRSGGWRGIYFAISRSIRNAFVIELDAAGFRSEGAVYPLELSLTAANRTWTSKLQLNVPAGGTAAAPPGSPAPAAQTGGGEKAAGSPAASPWMMGGAVAILAVAVAGWLWVRRRRGAPPTAPASVGEPAVAAPTPNEPPVPSPTTGAAAVPAAGVLTRLTRIHEGPPPHQLEIEIIDRVVLGSDPAVSHLVFEQDREIAPAHCELFFEAGRLYLRNLATTGDTFLNGVALTARQSLEEQDVLKIGRTEMRITFPI